MKVNDIVQRRGCITLAKYVRGRTTAELERDLGYRSGRLSNGAFIGVLRQLPQVYEFDLLGYSNVAEHHFKKPDALDISKLKNLVRTQTWSAFGENQPVKIFPISGQGSDDLDLEYPPGWGVPQWKLTSLMAFEIVAFMERGERAVW